MKTLYIEGSKKAANEALNRGEPVPAVEYIMLDTTNYKDLRNVHEDAVIKFWRKRDSSGNPIAVSYGNWLHKKGTIK